MNLAVCVGLAVVALSRLFAPAASARTVGQVLALLAIVVLGYSLARSKRLGMVWSILAFTVAWFWMPVVPLAALWIAGMVSKNRNVVAEMTFVQELAGGEFRDGVKATYVGFGSIYGEHTIPLLVDVDGRDHAVYVESDEWTWPTKTRFYRWLTALRTSDRENLPVIVRGRHEVPADVSGYVEPNARNKFELAGLLNIEFTETPGFAELNVITLKRLAHEYFDVTLFEGAEGLAELDRLVIERLRPASRFLPSTVLLLGSFFGESLIHAFGGEWQIRGKTTDNVSIEIQCPNGSLEANVFGKAVKLLRNGSQDSLAAMAASISNRLTGEQ
jgi:hypothetical protein